LLPVFFSVLTYTGVTIIESIFGQVETHHPIGGKRMPDTLSTTEATLNSFFTTLYLVPSDDNPPSTNPTLVATDHSQTTLLPNPEIIAARYTFLTNWKASVEIESSYLGELSKPQQTSSVRKLASQVEDERKKAHKATNNTINLYVYLLVEDKLESTVTPETIRETTKSLKNYIAFLHGDQNSVDPLVQQLQIVHGKQREFTTELTTVLLREALSQQAGLRKVNTELTKEK
jgi:hypothetical protein